MATKGRYCPVHEWRAKAVDLLEPPPMTIVCAWCGLVLLDGSDTISHGICEPCKASWEGRAHSPAAVAAREIGKLYGGGAR